MADLDWPAVLRAVRDRLGSIGATATAQVGVTVFHACNAVADEIERQQRTAQEPAAVSADEPAEVVRPSAPAPASNRCVSCQREVGPSPGWHECEPPIADTDGLDNAEATLRRLADFGDTVLLSGEAGLIVDELDRLRSELARVYDERDTTRAKLARADAYACAMEAERNAANREKQRTIADCDRAVTEARRERDNMRTALAAKEQERWDEHEAAERHLRERDVARDECDTLRARTRAAETVQALESEQLLARGRAAERAAVVAWLRESYGAHNPTADAIERGEHLTTEDTVE